MRWVFFRFWAWVWCGSIKSSIVCLGYQIKRSRRFDNSLLPPTKKKGHPYGWPFLFRRVSALHGARREPCPPQADLDPGSWSRDERLALLH